MNLKKTREVSPYQRSASKVGSPKRTFGGSPALMLNMNSNLETKEMSKLMNKSPKIKQARDDYFRKKINHNIYKLMMLLRQEKNAK